MPAFTPGRTILYDSEIARGGRRTEDGATPSQLAVIPRKTTIRLKAPRQGDGSTWRGTSRDTHQTRLGHAGLSMGRAMSHGG